MRQGGWGVSSGTLKMVLQPVVLGSIMPMKIHTFPLPPPPNPRKVQFHCTFNENWFVKNCSAPRKNT